ncbi:BT_3928 family protein [Chryseobacterium sp. A301]
MFLKSFLRILIALIFLVSGFVKAVDPVGFSFKLEEYFSPAVFNLPFFESYALVLSILVVALELLLGLALLIGLRLRQTLLILIALCVFFAFLTFYSAYFNVVTDCGCFGDALKLEPWQSFWKDIILLAGLLVLWKGYSTQHSTKGSEKWKWIAMGAGLLCTVFIVCIGIKSEPLIDFRDYKVGTDLKAEKRKLTESPAQYQTVYALKNTKTGEEKEVSQDAYIADAAYWSEGSVWEIQKDATRQELVKKGYESEVLKFRIENKKGEDITPSILEAEHVVLLFSYAPQDLSPQTLKKAQDLVRGHPLVYGVSTSLQTFSDLENTTMDPTAMKTIARSNPFVLVLHKGKIVVKKPIDEYPN